jgi:hypothetical protein
MDDSPIETLTGLEMLESVEFTVAGERVDALSNSKVVEDDRIVVVVSERGGDRKFRIETQWANGWLEPLVDVYDASDDEPSFEPAGTLEGIDAAGYPAL